MSDDIKKFVNFMQEFRAAGDELVDRVTEALVEVKKALHADGIKLSHEPAMAMALAHDRVADGIKRQIENYTKQDQPDLYERYGPDGRKALYALLNEDGIDSIARAPEVVANKSAVLVARKRQQLLLKEIQKGVGYLIQHTEKIANKTSSPAIKERLLSIREDIESLGFRGRVPQSTVDIYAEHRKDAIELAQSIVRRMALMTPSA